MINVIINNGKIKVASPYNKFFVLQARNLGGRWKSAEKVWEFDVRDEERVRDLCREVYGNDGQTTDTVTLRVKWAEGMSEYQGPLCVAGRPVARAWGRDSGAKLCEGIVLLKGKFDSGGSLKNWDTRVVSEGGVELLVRDFPRAKAEELIQTEPNEYSVESAENDSERERLLVEREKLVARLTEIDARLVEIGTLGKLPVLLDK